MYSLCSSYFVPNNGLILDIKKLENIQLIHTLCTCDTINDFLVSLRAFGERYILKKSKNEKIGCFSKTIANVFCHTLCRHMV